MHEQLDCSSGYYDEKKQDAAIVRLEEACSAGDMSSNEETCPAGDVSLTYPTDCDEMEHLEVLLLVWLVDMDSDQEEVVVVGTGHNKLEECTAFGADRMPTLDGACIAVVLNAVDADNAGIQMVAADTDGMDWVHVEHMLEAKKDAMPLSY